MPRLSPESRLRTIPARPRSPLGRARHGTIGISLPLDWPAPPRSQEVAHREADRVKGEKRGEREKAYLLQGHDHGRLDAGCWTTARRASSPEPPVLGLRSGQTSPASPTAAGARRGSSAGPTTHQGAPGSIRSCPSASRPPATVRDLCDRHRQRILPHVALRRSGSRTTAPSPDLDRAPWWIDAVLAPVLVP
jgi:hypothetical protein